MAYEKQPIAPAVVMGVRNGASLAGKRICHKSVRVHFMVSKPYSPKFDTRSLLLGVGS